jgi:MtN3 and saliva related transmembrane protein
MMSYFGGGRNVGDAMEETWVPRDEPATSRGPATVPGDTLLGHGSAESGLIEALGFIAAACTTFAFVPQVLRVYRTRSANDISLSMYIILLAGIGLWIVYGTHIHSLPLVLANGVTLLLAGAVLIGKLKFKR